MKFIKIKISLLMSAVFLLAGCSNQGTIVVNNSLPRAKLVLKKNPDEKIFYSANYGTVSQSIYDENTEIFLLKDGKNEFPLDKTAKGYAAYFILPKKSDSEQTSWKYLLEANEGADFIINGKGTVEKE